MGLLFIFIGIFILGLILNLIDFFYNRFGRIYYEQGALYDWGRSLSWTGFLCGMLIGIIMMVGMCGSPTSLQRRYDKCEYRLEQIYQNGGVIVPENNEDFRGLLSDIYYVNMDIDASKRHLNSKWIGKMYRKEIAEMTPIDYKLIISPADTLTTK